MRRRQFALLATGVLTVGVIVGVVAFALERLMSPPIATPAETAAPAPAAVVSHITATLYYGSTDGQALVPVHQDVPLAAGVAAQGQEILRAQLGPAPAPYLSVIPPGASLRAFFVTERGDAFVDLGGIAPGHASGAATELLTVHALVNAVTANLPSIRRVQILLDGHEVDTLGGHVDLRQPFERDGTLVREAPGNQLQ